MLRVLAALGLAGLLGIAAPLAAQAASTPPASPSPTMTRAASLAASYPPASTGTFAVTAHPGTNRVTINGLGAREKVTAIVSGHGAAPSLGPISGSPKTETANLSVGETDGSGSVSFNLVFAAGASGVYNVSVSTPDGKSESGSVTIPGKDGSVPAMSGTRIALWVLWIAGLVAIFGAIGMLTNAVRRRARA